MGRKGLRFQIHAISQAKGVDLKNCIVKYWIVLLDTTRSIRASTTGSSINLSQNQQETKKGEMREGRRSECPYV